MQVTTGETLWFLGNTAVVHAASDATGGRYCVVELTGPPGDTPPLHVHPDDDEGFFVLEGSLRLHVGAETFHLSAGEFALAPRGTPHVYVVDSDVPARWLATSGGGFDRFVMEVARPAKHDGLPPADSLPDPAVIAEIAARHGIEILGPPGTLPS
jgi:quercetin dioxygenase-like cupin family protein